MYKIIREKSVLVDDYNKFVLTKIVNENTLDKEFKEIRDHFLLKYDDYIVNAKKDYDIDLNFALDFYEFLKNKKSFTRSMESDDDFWKNIAIYVIPDIIAKRHPEMNSDYYYSKNVRVYPYALFWYVNLSWQGNREETYNVLKNNSTDEIMQMVERPSTIGINVDLYRKIMKKFSTIPLEKRTICINGEQKKVFRLIFIKNTAKLTNFRPEIYPGGIDGYVDMLFESYI